MRVGGKERIESKLDLVPPERFDMGSVLWCLRTRKYLERVGRAAELMTWQVAGELVAFVARPLPLKAMRGVPQSQWLDAGHDDEQVRQAANDNTERRFAELLERIHKIDRIPADGWRISVDELFCSSAVLLAPVRTALVAKSQSEILLAVPDRSVVLVLPVNAAAAPRFGQRATREWREAMNPCSRQVLVTDGDELRLHEPPGDRANQGLMSWLRS